MVAFIYQLLYPNNRNITLECRTGRKQSFLCFYSRKEIVYKTKQKKLDQFIIKQFKYNNEICIYMIVYLFIYYLFGVI